MTTKSKTKMNELHRKRTLTKDSQLTLTILLFPLSKDCVSKDSNFLIILLNSESFFSCNHLKLPLMFFRKL